MGILHRFPIAAVGVLAAILNIPMSAVAQTEVASCVLEAIRTAPESKTVGEIRAECRSWETADADRTANVRRDFGDSGKLRFHLAPPMISRAKDARGRPRKKEFGAWIVPVFRILARMRSLRGTKLDIFGLTAERRMERALITEFEELIDQILPSLSANNLAVAHEIIVSYMDIRGFGPVKEEAAAAVRDRVAILLQGYLNVDRRAA